jgi:hypothetical protein
MLNYKNGENPDVEDDYVEEEYMPDYTQDMADRDALYESEQITLEIANEAIGYPTQDYVEEDCHGPNQRRHDRRWYL